MRVIPAKIAGRCTQQKQLLEWSRATAAYFAAVETLADSYDTSSASEIASLQDTADWARAEVDRARFNLDRHRLEHRC